MVAKIADLGVARIMPRMRAAATMTMGPGAIVYMPQRPWRTTTLKTKKKKMKKYHKLHMVEASTSFLLVS